MPETIISNTQLATDQSGVEVAAVTDGMPVAQAASFTDAESASFFRRQLTQIERDEDYFISPNLTTQAFSVSRSGGWNEYFTYAIKRYYGEAVIAECCDKVPTVGFSQCEVSSSALTLQVAAKWCIFDVLRARQAREDLEANYVMGAREALETKLEEMIWSGYTPLGVTGILNNTTINRINVGGLGTISEDLIRVIAQIRNTIITTLNGRAQSPNSLAVPPSIYALMQVSVTGNNDRSLLAEVQSRFGLNVIEIPYLERAGMGDTPIMVMYRREPNYISVRIPFDTVPMEVFFDGRHYCRHWYTRFGGVRIDQPETFTIIEGLGNCAGKISTLLENCQGRYTCV